MTAMPIGQRVQQRRQRLGWTQEDLAHASKVRQATISRIEQGQRKNPGADVIRRLARALGVTSDWLIGMYEDDDQEDGEPAGMELVGA
jgi:transcriptional regulator with XRE-family HTH domain